VYNYSRVYIPTVNESGQSKEYFQYWDMEIHSSKYTLPSMRQDCHHKLLWWNSRSGRQVPPVKGAFSVNYYTKRNQIQQPTIYARRTENTITDQYTQEQILPLTRDTSCRNERRMINKSLFEASHITYFLNAYEKTKMWDCICNWKNTTYILVAHKRGKIMRWPSNLKVQDHLHPNGTQRGQNGELAHELERTRPHTP
jgi:hypothetical protein